MASRRRAREVLLKAFYLSESRGYTLDDAVGEMVAVDEEIVSLGDDPESVALKPFSFGLDNQQKKYVLSLGRKIEQNRDLLNGYIKPILKNWNFSRISRIDRIILWISIAEMLFMLDIPKKVSINEAIELSKDYSSEKSSSFINGILDRIAKDIT